MKLELAGSILGANPLNIGGAITTAKLHGLKRLHIDIMDGNYVSNISFGLDIITAIKAYCDLVMDVHLMVNCTENMVQQCLQAGVDSISIHPKTCKDPMAIIQLINNHCTAGIVINPDEELAEFKDLIPKVNLITLMSVTPGACGQKFIPETLNKITELRQSYSGVITIDGGVNPKICEQLLQYKIERVVAGSALFAGDIAHNIAEFIDYCDL